MARPRRGDRPVALVPVAQGNSGDRGNSRYSGNSGDRRSPLRSRMKFDPAIHHRRSIRLEGYDYAGAGAYFVTICVQDKKCLFGEIVAGEMVLNDAGGIVADEWLKTARIRQEIELDEWVVMPNHFHGIVVITRRGDRPVALVGDAQGNSGDRGNSRYSGNSGDRRSPLPRGPQPKSIGALMAGFKSAATKRINELRQTPGTKIWQRNYWEHVIRNGVDLHEIREYIQNNPLKWELDNLYAR